MKLHCRTHMLLKSRLSLLAILISPLVVAGAISTRGVALEPMQSEAVSQAGQTPATATQEAQPDPAASSATPTGSEKSQQQRIEADTKKLYQLALELRTEVGKTYKQSLSLAVLKKAGELEKLAKNLKSEMDHEATAKKR
ncbi:MAG TPA: hypothetical protein VL135_16285 [Terracidiphilus sp.]|nr:hypothetical protein [Terracidiphilus sp.]